MNTAQLKRTPLFDAHRRANAKLIDFGGWEMPLHYGSQIEEHHRVRRDAGMFDVSHMLSIDFSGRQARDFLGTLLANDVGKLAAPGKALYSCMLNEDGGVLDDLIVYWRADDRFRAVVNAATADQDLAWIEQQRDRRAPGVAAQPRRDLAMLAVQGPQARERVWRVRPAWRAGTEALAAFQAREAGTAFVARTGYTGEDGFELMVPAEVAEALWNDLLDAGVAPCGLGARDTLRLEAGMNLYGQDMDASTTPYEAGLGWTVAMADAREFIGRAALAQRAVRWNLRGLVLRDRGVLRSHQPVRGPHGPGEVTSGTFSPTLGQSIALARLPPTAAAGEMVEVQVRDRWLAAQVVNYPFVRRGKSLLPG